MANAFLCGGDCDWFITCSDHILGERIEQVFIGVYYEYFFHVIIPYL